MKSTTLGDVLRGVFTIAIIVMGGYWLVIVAGYLDAPTVKDPQNNVIDPYTRSKDILLIVVPLLTIVFGYWFGQQGREAAEKKADAANEKLTSVLDVAEPDLLRQAKSKNPEAFAAR